MKPVEPEILCGKDFVAVRTSYRFAYAAPGRTAGSTWRQTVLFPLGERFFLLCDEVETVNASPEMFLRTDMPGGIRHQHGESFSEVNLSYLGRAEGLRVPAREFLDPFPPNRRFHSQPDQRPLPEEFIRGYRLRDRASGQEGPGLAGMTLAASVVYEAWCNRRLGGIVVMILEIHGRPIRPEDSVGPLQLVGWFDSMAQMYERYRKSRGRTGWEISPQG